MANLKTYSGGCLCGACRYQIDDIFDAGYCHCRSCRRATGGILLAWAHVFAPDFELYRGEPKSYSVSKRGSRHFCDKCGSTLYFTSADGSFYSVTLGTFDEPKAVSPKVHICVDDAIDWLDIDDELPRCGGRQTSHPDKRG